MAYTIAYYSGMLNDLTPQQLIQLIVDHTHKQINARSIRNWRKAHNLP